MNKNDLLAEFLSLKLREKKYCSNTTLVPYGGKYPVCSFKYNLYSEKNGYNFKQGDHVFYERVGAKCIFLLKIEIDNFEDAWKKRILIYGNEKE